MEKAEAVDEIQRCLALLGLENQRRTLGKNLSAGTKRKLCVGMAFSAGSKVSHPPALVPKQFQDAFSL